MRCRVGGTDGRALATGPRFSGLPGGVGRLLFRDSGWQTPGLCGSCVLRRPPRIIRGGAPQDGDPGLPGLGGREAAGPAPRSEGLQDGQPIREPGCPRLREPSVEACVEWGKRSFGLF